MTTKARIGYGAQFAIGDAASPEVFTALDIEITGIKPPSFARDSIDASHEQSPSSFREFIAGLVDAGEFSFEFNFFPGTGQTGYSTLYAELSLSGAAATKNRKITFPDGSDFVFAAFLTGLEEDAPLDDKMSGTATFKITGKPTLTQV